MKKALETLHRINSVNGNGSQALKKDLLRENDSPELRFLLKVAFDPFIVTRIANIGVEIYCPEIRDCWTLNQFQALIEKMGIKKGITNEDRFEYESLVNCWKEQYERDLMAKIVTKTLNIGIGAKIINDAFQEKLIPDTIIMKAEDNPELIKKFKGKIFADLKYDGVRCWTVLKSGKVQSMKTYNFQELPLMYFKRIIEQIETIFGLFQEEDGEEMFIDGELTDFDRKSVTGKINKVLKGKSPEDIGDEIMYNIFDIDLLRTIKDGSGIFVYSTRRQFLNDIFNVKCKWVDVAGIRIWQTDYENAEKNRICQNINYKPSIECESIEEALYHAQLWMLEGEEGAVIKDGEAVYECKRSKSWIKVKAKNECDLRIVDYFSGKENTKREGFIGGFVCESEDKKLSVKVGSGLTDEDLNFINKITPEHFIGKIVKVKYNMKITDKQGNISLFLPRFDKYGSFEESIRIDKDIADIEKNIK